MEKVQHSLLCSLSYYGTSFLWRVSQMFSGTPTRYCIRKSIVYTFFETSVHLYKLTSPFPLTDMSTGSLH